MRKDASWRRMLVVQAPVPEICIMARYHDGSRFPGGPRIMPECIRGKATILEGILGGIS